MIFNSASILELISLELLDNSTSNIQILENVDYLYMRSSGIVDNKKFIKKLVGDVKIISKFNVKNIEILKGGYKNITDIYGNKLIRGNTKEREALAKLKALANKSNIFTKIIEN